MKERPILFSAPMVRALLEGRKTQTRRVVKPQPQDATVTSAGVIHSNSASNGCWSWLSGDPIDMDTWEIVGDDFRCPYGVPGDRLWVRETWQHANFPLGPYQPGVDVFYAADYTDGLKRHWLPSIHMPRALSRITLEITKIRAERLQAITNVGAEAEGAPGAYPIAEIEFRDLWESIHGHGSWAINPWVWVIEFERVSVRA